MKLSIIIPIYNVSTYLSNTLDSVITQTYKDFELILVDDGSTDGSEVICDNYAQSDNRIRVIHQDNAGVSAARNTGVAAATGDYIGFVDSDDIIEKDMFAVMMNLAEAENTDVVQCQHDRMECLNNLPRAEKFEMFDGRYFVRRMFEKKGAEYTNQVALWSKIYRRELFEGIVFPVGQTYEDEQETYKICLKANKIAEVSDVLYHYIKRENSIITGISARKMLDKQAALLDRLYYLPELLPDLEEQCARSFISFSEHIMCQMYNQKSDYDNILQTEKVLHKHIKNKAEYINKYEKIYFKIMKYRMCRDYILKNDFEPIQKLISYIRK